MMRVSYFQVEKIILELVINLSKNLIVDKYNFVETMLEKISKNSNYCLDCLSNDLEILECADDFEKTIKRKRKSSRPAEGQNTQKKRRKTKCSTPKEADEEQVVSVSSYIKDEAEGLFLNFS